MFFNLMILLNFRGRGFFSFDFFLFYQHIKIKKKNEIIFSLIKIFIFYEEFLSLNEK